MSNLNNSNSTGKSPEISVIIPVYNNQNTLKELTSQLFTVFQNITDSYEILFVNDASPDCSFVVLKMLQKKFDKIKVLNLKKNMGQHKAICFGLKYALGDNIVIMDADLQDDQ